MNTLGINEINYYRLEWELFRGSARGRGFFALRSDLLLPVAAGVFSFFVSDKEKFRAPARGMFRVSGRDLLLATVPKVGKSTGRNQRFLHLLARYAVGKGESACHTFTQIFLCRFVKGLSQQQRRCR